MLDTTEKAKAVQEVAKTTRKAIDASQGVGEFLKDVFGDLLINGVGLMGDKLKYYRLGQLELLKERVNKNHADKGVTSTHAIPPKIGVPLIEKATIENDDDLHQRWSNMLANALSSEYKGAMKRSYISILSDMEAIDVLIFDVIVKEYIGLDVKQKENALFDMGKLSQNINVSGEQLEVSLRNLLRLGCLKPGVFTNEAVRVGRHGTTSYMDIKLVGVTGLGLEFYQSVN